MHSLRKEVSRTWLKRCSSVWTDKNLDIMFASLEGCLLSISGLYRNTLWELFRDELFNELRFQIFSRERKMFIKCFITLYNSTKRRLQIKTQTPYGQYRDVNLSRACFWTCWGNLEETTKAQENMQTPLGGGQNLTPNPRGLRQTVLTTQPPFP